MLVAAGAVLIVAAALYGPMALLAPLPPATMTALDLPAVPANSRPPALPTEGSAAVTLGAGQAPVGSGTVVPMAAAAKILTALLVLHAHPLDAGRSGPAVPVTAEDFATYQRYTAEGTRSVRVVAGDTWTEREALHAMLLASSNNHAEMLARWAFGSLDGYLAAAKEWLAGHGMADILVVDATGLSPRSAGSGTSLARLAALAFADPFLAEAAGLDRSVTTRGVVFENAVRYRPEDGITGLSRSYTDEAGVCLLFAAPVKVGAETVTVYGAFLGEPSYPALDADINVLLASAPTWLVRHELLAAGTPVSRYTTAWGATAHGVVSTAVTGLDWAGRGAQTSAERTTVTTAPKGAPVGKATVVTTEGPVSAPVLLDQALGDPGPVWRLLTPGVVVPRFVDWITGRA